MISSVWAVTSLLLSVGLLLLGHGIYLTFLPQLADSYGWSATQNALTTSAYFLGYGAGCFIVPAWLPRIGHIRVFAVLVSAATATLLALSLMTDPFPWIVLRFLYGIAISGIYLSVESWLNAATSPEHRGKVLSLYAFVTLIGILGAQLTLERLLVGGLAPLTVAAIFLSLAALPIGVTRREAPRLVVRPRLRADLLFNRGNAATLCGGVLNGTFWALAPIMAVRAGFGADAAARFMAAAIGGGMLTVYPLGWLSDRIGRTYVIGGIGVFGAVVTAMYIFLDSGTENALLLFGLVFGAAVMPLYSLCLALANDHARPDAFVETGSAVIVVNAAGMVIGPAMCAPVMTYHPQALAWFWIGSFVALFVAVAVVQRRAPVSHADTVPFTVVPRAAQEALAIDPRADPADAEAYAEIDDDTRTR